MTNNKHFRYYLVFDDKYISFKIAFFETKTEAEHWREFLAYTVQEFKYEEMKIIKISTYVDAPTDCLAFWLN